MRILNQQKLNKSSYNNIDVTRLLNRVLFHVSRLESQNNQIFRINTWKTNYLCNDLIQKAMRLINLDISLLDF